MKKKTLKILIINSKMEADEILVLLNQYRLENYGLIVFPYNITDYMQIFIFTHEYEEIEKLFNIKSAPIDHLCLLAMLNTKNTTEEDFYKILGKKFKIEKIFP